MTVRAGALNTSPLSSHHEFQSVDVVKLGKEIFKTNDVEAKNRHSSRKSICSQRQCSRH